LFELASRLGALQGEFFIMVRTCVRSMRSHSLRRPQLAAAAILALLAGQAAKAQSTWVNSSGGNWGVPANWNNLNVPDNAGESAIILPPGPYTVFLDNNYSINALTIAHLLARVDLQNNLNLTLSGGLDGAGVLTVNNAAGGNSTFIRLATSQNWIGTGKVVLNANAGNLDTAYIYFNGGGEVLTLASGKEILGTGRIYVSMVNNGGVIADAAGRVLELVSQAKTNNGEFAAVNGGVLQLNGISVAQGGTGIIRALTGSTVSIVNSSISGGKITTDAGGFTQFTGSSTLAGLSTAGVIDVLNNSIVRLANSLINDGDIRVNSGAGGNDTHIRAQNNLSLDGIGSITLRSNGANLDSAYMIYNGGGEIVTQGPQHAIRGSGNIYVSIVNNGLISASTAGRSLRLTAIAKTNNKTISADLGRLEIDATTVSQGPSGVISLTNAAGASLVVRNAVINSGSLQSVVNVITIEGTSTFNNTSINGPMLVTNNSAMQLTGAATTHSGDLFVNTGISGNSTLIRVLQNHTISGPGRIVLRAIPGNLDTSHLVYNGGGELLTQSAGHSIVGIGNIYVALANAGNVIADQSGATLQLLGFPKSNTGLMKSQSGGILQVNSVAVTQTGAGAIRADGGTVQTISASISGGLVESANGGVCVFSGTTNLGSITFAGAGNVPNNQQLQINGPIVNTGTLTVNPSAGGNSTLIRLVGSQSVSGSGSIVLNASPNLDTAHIVYNGGGEVFTQSAGHSIRGTGRIYVNMTNSGLVSANAAGKTLELLAFPKTNKSIFEATGGGILQFSSVTVNQDPGAKIRSTSGSLLNFISSSISGGTIESGSAALSDAAAAYGGTFSGVTIQGAVAVPNNNGLNISSGGLVNNGIITINPTSGGNATLLRAATSATISGTGSIVLNAAPGNLDTAHIVYNGGGETLTLGSGQTLAGVGNVYVRTINNGLLAPGGNPSGGEIGRINLPAFRYTQNPSGIMAFQISGPTPAEFDRVTGGATMDLAGALVPSIINGYDPVIGSTFDIIDGPAIAGEFASVGPRFVAQYFPNKVRVLYTGVACPADLNHDAVVDDADFVIFVPAYNLLDCADPAMPPNCPADMNRDGLVNDADFVIFLSQYNELICPE